MRPQRPVYWYSGQFLEPQHFQQADACHAAGRAGLLKTLRPCFWGVGEMEADESALAEGRAAIRFARLRFQDGTEAVAAATPEEGNAIIPPRRFREAWTDPHEPFTIYVGLPTLKAVGNVAGIPACSREGGRLTGYAEASLPAASGRYLCADSDDLIPDRYALPLAVESRSEAPVRTLYLYPRLFWPGETDRPDWLFLPLLRLKDEGRGPHLDPDFAPPSLSVAASPVLDGLVRRLETRLVALIRRLEPGRRRDPDAPVTSGQLLLVQAAGTLSDVRHALTWEDAPPWEVFGLLRHGFAALAACIGVPVADALPPYRHEDPALSFRDLENLLRLILRGFFPETAAVLRFRPDGDFLRADLPQTVEKTRPLIVLQSATPALVLLEEGRLVADAPQDLPETLARAVAGLPLREVPTPHGLTPRDDIRYLEPDTRSQRWQAVLRAGAIGLALFPEKENETSPQILARRLRLLLLRN